MSNIARTKVQALAASVQRHRAFKRKAQALAVMAQIPKGRMLVPFITDGPADSNVEAISFWLESVPGSQSLSLPLLRDALTRQLRDAMEAM